MCAEIAPTITFILADTIQREGKTYLYWYQAFTQTVTSYNYSEHSTFGHTCCQQVFELCPNDALLMSII